MALEVWVNCSSSDLPLDSSGVDWVQLSEGNDQIIFTAGSDVVEDGDVLPSQNELVQAGVVRTGSEIIVDKYFLADVSDDELKEIFLMGNQNTRYVLAFSFDAATASEPVLEAWDDDTFDSVDAIILGSGTPSQSFFRGVTTTDALPGTNWTGSRLAGGGSGNFLELNSGNGALSGADVLYANLKLIIPASQVESFGSNTIFVVKYLSN